MNRSSDNVERNGKSRAYRGIKSKKKKRKENIIPGSNFDNRHEGHAVEGNRVVRTEE